MDFLFGLDKPATPDKDTAFWTTVHDNVELEIIRDILAEEGIPCRSCERGSGSAVKILTGYSMYGSDIYVPVAALEQAQELLEAFRNAEIVEPDTDEVEE